MERENKIEITDELMTRYITGDASPDEALALSDWLSVEENRKQFDQLEAGWLQALPAGKPAFNKSDAWRAVSGKMVFSTPQAKTSTLGRPVTLVFKIAASLLLIGVVVASIIYSRINDTDTRSMTLATTTESKEHTFADQSIVTLYRNSSIDYPESFSAHTREISLMRGEAFFKISHDDQKPFIVHTPDAAIKVVGTEFDVITKDAGTEVSVREGKVMVSIATDTLLLTAGQSAIIQPGKTEILAENVRNINVWGYATRKLVFANTPLRDAIEGIEKAYPNTISLSNKSIENCHVTATFDNESVDKIVNLVADILNLTVTKNGETFTLEGQGCQ